MFFTLTAGAWAQGKALQLSQTIPLPDLHDGDFDHFTVDLHGNRLFVAAEENSKVLVFDLRTNKLLHTITDLKAPHAMLFREDLKKLFVVDGDLPACKIYNSETYQPITSIKLLNDADSMNYDPVTKYLYIVNGGREAHVPYELISIIDGSLELCPLHFGVSEDRIELLAIRHDNIFFLWEEAPSRALCVHHVPKFSTCGLFEIVPVTLFHDPAAFEDVHEIRGADLGEIVCDYNRRHVCSPSLDGFKHKYARRRFVCAEHK